MRTPLVAESRGVSLSSDHYGRSHEVTTLINFITKKERENGSRN